MITWTEAYNCHTAILAKGAIRLSVAWNSLAPKDSPNGYVVVVCGRQLKNLIRDLDEAKAAAVRLAKQIVAEASADLEGA